jgi:hypothetical protein
MGALYLGALSALLDTSSLRALDISVIVQSLCETDLMLGEEDGLIYHRVELEDTDTQILSHELLEQVCTYIDDMRSSGKSILVHCHQASLSIT